MCVCRPLKTVVFQCLSRIEDSLLFGWGKALIPENNV